MGTDAIENTEDIDLNVSPTNEPTPDMGDGMPESDEPDMDKENDEDEDQDDNVPLSDRKGSENAVTLLNQAIKHLEDDNEKTALNYIKLAVKYIKGEAEIEPEEKDTKLYGECRNFGVIYHIMESNSANLYRTTNGRKALKEFVNLIKNNKVLNEEFRYYSLYADLNVNGDNMGEYVNEAVSYAPTIDKKTLKLENQKLIDALRKSEIDEMIEISDEDMRLYESIETTIIAKSSPKSINEMIEAKSAIGDYLKGKPQINEKKSVTYKDYENAVADAVKEINENMSEDEYALIQEMSKPDCDKKMVFEIHKSDLLKKISHAMNLEENNDAKTRLSKLYVQINEQTYNESSVLLDVAKFINVKNVLD